MIDTPNGFIERDAKIIISPYHLEIYWLSFKDLPVDHDLLVGDHCHKVKSVEIIKLWFHRNPRSIRHATLVD